MVRIVEFSKEDTPLLDFEVKVHSIRSRCWKKIKEELPMKECSICSSSASLNGAIHWLIAPPCGPSYSTRPESLLHLILPLRNFKSLVVFVKNLNS